MSKLINPESLELKEDYETQPVSDLLYSVVEMLRERSQLLDFAWMHSDGFQFRFSHQKIHFFKEKLYLNNEQVQDLRELESKVFAEVGRYKTMYESWQENPPKAVATSTRYPKPDDTWYYHNTLTIMGGKDKIKLIQFLRSYVRDFKPWGIDPERKSSLAEASAIYNCLIDVELWYNKEHFERELNKMDINWRIISDPHDEW